MSPPPTNILTTQTAHTSKISFESLPHSQNFKSKGKKKTTNVTLQRTTNESEYRKRLLKCLLPAATKLGQGNIFRSVYQEFCPQGGGCLPQCMLGFTPPPEQTPPREETPPRADTPQIRHHPPGSTPPRADIPPPRADTPQIRHHPPGSTAPPPEQTPPPGKRTAAYGQRAADTHPTGMHSCYFLFQS